MSAPFNILGIDHVVLRAADPAALERFYVDVLGCTVEKRQAAISLTQLRAGRTLIDIVPGRTGGSGRRRAGRARRQPGSSSACASSRSMRRRSSEHFAATGL